MGRLLQAAALVMAMTALAVAAPKRKVRVESTPPGAAVYIESIENGKACDATPCTIDVPLGSATLIIRLEGHEPEFEALDVTRGTKPLKVSVKLKGAVGTIRIYDAPKGATVKVNDEDKGKVTRSPYEVEVPAEPASVVVTLGGKTLAQELVDVEAGAEIEIRVKAGGGTATREPPDDNDDDSDGPDVADGSDDGDDPIAGDDTDTGAVSDTAPAAARAPYLEAGLAMDVAFRRFTYTDGTMPFNNSGEVVIGPAVEVWPGRLLGVRRLRGLSLFARVQFSPTHQAVTREMNGQIESVGASTFWGGLELSLRQKWTFGSIGVEASGGFVRDQVEFSATTQSVLDMVPSADYKSLRLGVRASYVARIEPYVSAESRIVFSGGELANRADRSETSGYRVAAGARTKLGPVNARVEGAYGAYSWTFDSDTAGGPPGASDKIYWLSLLVGYVY